MEAGEMPCGLFFNEGRYTPMVYKMILSNLLENPVTGKESHYQTFPKGLGGKTEIRGFQL